MDEIEFHLTITKEAISYSYAPIINVYKIDYGILVQNGIKEKISESCIENIDNETRYFNLKIEEIKDEKINYFIWIPLSIEIMKNIAGVELNMTKDF